MDSDTSVSRTRDDFVVDCVSPQSDALGPYDPLSEDFGTPERSLLDKSDETSDNRDEVSVSDSSANIVATWADEFYRITGNAKFSGQNFEHQDLVANSVDPPLSQGAFAQLKQPPQELLPTSVDHYGVEVEKQYKCHFCKTSYGTTGRLKRHFSTKKHKTATEKVALDIEKSPKIPPPPPPPPTPSQNFQPETEKLPDIPALSADQIYQTPVKLPQMQMPRFKSYSEYATSAPIDSYPTDWTVYHNQVDFLRSSQTQTPSLESHHAPNSLFFQHRPSPEMYYGKIPFNNLCNSHQSSPQFVSEPPIPPIEQPRTYPHPSLYQPQAPPTSSWYYPITPYPSPNPYLQRYPDFSTAPTSEYQKFETNNNYFPTDPDPKPFDQRPYQQEALNLWTPKMPCPEADVEEIDAESTDSSETMSPAVSSDSQHEPVSSSDFPEPGIESKWHCEECNRDFTKACYLTQHNNAMHPDECPFTCEICNQRFSMLTSLAKHSCANVGIGGEQFTCDICDKGFGSKVELKRHKYLHSASGSGAKNFSCHLCPKTCARKDQLLRHIRVHESHAENLTKQFSG